jgi:hypothetical protein
MNVWKFVLASTSRSSRRMRNMNYKVRSAIGLF